MRSRLFFLSTSVLASLVAVGCGSDKAVDWSPPEGDQGSLNETNPFLEDQRNLTKADTGYANPAGIEVEVDIEADVEASLFGGDVDSAPAQLGQFAMTYLRDRKQFYLESLAEDSSTLARVEWLVDGAWKSAVEVAGQDTGKNHFRIRGVNAVLLNEARTGVAEGSTFTAKVPRNPASIMSDVGGSCAKENAHVPPSDDVYWYLWNPDLPGCQTSNIQDMTLTVSKFTPVKKVTFPEYDRLVADGKVTAVLLFGQISSGGPTDPGRLGFMLTTNWLKQGGFQEVTPAPVGRRFTKHIGQVDFEIDLYSIADFSGLGDTAHFDNFQKAISEHEIVSFDGHSMLGASDFWGRPTYPDFYQIYLYGGCLGYEYYVRPIVQGKKGGWKDVDIVSSVVEVPAGSNVAGAVLAKMIWALEPQNKFNASWDDIVSAIGKRTGTSYFGVSGVTDNCFSPAGSLCGLEEPTSQAKKYENPSPTPIPDAPSDGVTSSIDVPDAITPKTVSIDLDVSHSWVGDLRISLEHDGTETVVWDQVGTTSTGIKQVFELSAFANMPAAGAWQLRIVDTSSQDTGTLNRWGLLLEP